MKNVYLDNNATTRPAPEAIEAMLPLLRDEWGNPSSMHYFGGHVRKYLERAREQVAALIGAADPTEIVFTGCGTESDNMAIRGAAETLGTGARVVTTRVEHPAVLEPCRALRERGFSVIEIGVDGKGCLDMDALRDTVKDSATVTSVMWANNETGVIFPVEEIGALVRQAGGVFHTDAVQAVGKIPFRVADLPIDLLSLSGHKLHAPKGVGALYVRKGTRLRPFQLGGHQENGRRAGTENVPSIAALGRASELARQAMREEMATVAALRDRLESGLLAACPESFVNGDTAHRLPNTTNISFRYIEGEAILYHLSDEGIAASSGSACAAGSLEPSHVIRAMGVPFTAAHGSIRFSLSRYNTAEDIEYVLEKLPPIVRRLRAISPFVNRP